MARWRRTTALVATLAVAAVVAACGDDGSPAPAGPSGRAFYPLPEVERRLERVAGLELLRTGGGAGVAGEVRPAPVDAVRYGAARSGREFDVLVFASRSAARRARASLRETEVIRDGGAYIQGANVIAVTARPPRGALERRLFSVIRGLATGREPRAPDAEGSLAGEALPIGAELEVGGIAYEVVNARQLNPAIAPDGDLVATRPARPGAGERLLFGVFVRACNEGDQQRRSSADVRLLTVFGDAVAPSGAAEERFALRAAPIPPGRCLPAEGSAAERTVDGALASFDVPRRFLQDRPLLLEVRAGSERGLVELDA
jgi:hypothetical protein